MMTFNATHTARAANDNAAISARAVAAIPAVKRFEVGRTYWTRSICDYDCIHSFEILARTAKTVTVKVHGKIKRRGVTVSSGEECFAPFGRYSMAAIISAGRQG
jgi:hypothetical protein